MAKVDLGVGLAEAIARLRGHAFADGISSWTCRETSSPVELFSTVTLADPRPAGDLTAHVGRPAIHPHRKGLT